MLRKELGSTGLMIPELGFGTWRYQGGEDPLRRGFDLGALFVDTAESYGTEEVVGKAIQGLRDRVFLATKLSPKNFRPSDILKAVENSLRRLRTDYIDLYQLHYPNYNVPIAETMGAMEQLVDAGKIRHIGVSNFLIKELKEAQKVMRKHPIVSNQLRYSLVERTIELGLLQYCQRNRVTVIAFSPLAENFQQLIQRDPRGVIARIASVLGQSAARVALNWCLCREGVVVIPKASTVAHVEDDCGASGWRLSPDQFEELRREVGFRQRSHLEFFIRRLVQRALQHLRRL